MRKATLLLLMLAAMLNMNAQTDDEYLMEIGGPPADGNVACPPQSEPIYGT